MFSLSISTVFYRATFASRASFCLYTAFWVSIGLHIPIFTLPISTQPIFGGISVHNTSGLDKTGYLMFRKSERLRQIWQDPKIFENWSKGNHSKTRINNLMSHDQASAVLGAALNMNLKIDINPDGLAGLKKLHCKVRSTHIPVQPGLQWP